MATVYERLKSLEAWREEVEEKLNPIDTADLHEKFKEFWEIYPPRNGKKLGKAMAVKKFDLKFADDILKATRNYANSKVVQDGFAKDPQRFLINNYWRDWLDGAGQIETTKETEQQEIAEIIERKRHATK